MKNQASGKVWTDGGITYSEVIYQEYSNCKFSAGMIEGHPIDTMYLRAEKDGAVTTQLLLRPDEMAAIGWLATGSLWTNAMKELP